MGRLLATAIVSVVGIFFAILYHDWWKADEKKQHEDESSDPSYRRCVDSIAKVVDPHIQGVLKDYEIMNREIETRGNITLAVGAILIAASFLILANVATNKVDSSLKYAMCGVSMTLYFIWFFVLNLTTKKLDNITFSQIIAIEQGLSQKFRYDFGIHSLIRSKTKSERMQTETLAMD